MENGSQDAMEENGDAAFNQDAFEGEEPVQAVSEVQHVAEWHADASRPRRVSSVKYGSQGADATAVGRTSQSAEGASPEEEPQQASSSAVHSRKVSHASAGDNASRRQSHRKSRNSSSHKPGVDPAAAREETIRQYDVVESPTDPGENAWEHQTPASAAEVLETFVAEDSSQGVSAHLRRESDAMSHTNESSRRELTRSSRRKSSTRRQSQTDVAEGDVELLRRRQSSRRKSSTRRKSQADGFGGERDLPARLSLQGADVECTPAAGSSTYLDQQRQSTVQDPNEASEIQQTTNCISAAGTAGISRSGSGAAANTEDGNVMETRPPFEMPPEASANERASWVNHGSNSSIPMRHEHPEATPSAPEAAESAQGIIPGQIQEDEEDMGSQPQLQAGASPEEAPPVTAVNTSAESLPDVSRSSVRGAIPHAGVIDNAPEECDNADPGENLSRPTAQPTVRVVVREDAEEKESRGCTKRPTFFQSLVKDGEVDFGPNTSRLDKIRVVSFSGGRVFDALHLEENCIFVKDKKKYVPLDQLRSFIRIMVEDMEKMKRQSIDAITEMEWNFRILDQKTKKRCETQVNAVKSRALEKLEVLRRKVIEYKAQMEFFETQYHQLKETFEERVRKFKEHMPKDLQELDARWQEKVTEVQKVLQTTQSALDSSQKVQEEVGAKINKFIEELNKADASPHLSGEAGLLEKINDLHAVVRKVVEDNNKEQVALVVRQLVDRVEAEQQEKKIASLERENGALKDVCGTGLQRRMAEYEKEIADLQAACRAAETGAGHGGGASYEEIEKLRNELTVLNAENMILRRKVNGGEGGASRPIDGALAARDGDFTGAVSGADPLLIQELTLTVEDLERQIKNLKEENEQLQSQLIMSEESAPKAGKAVGKTGEGAGARLVQQLQQKNKMLEAQVEPMKKKIRELEILQKRGGGAEADQRVRELEMKLKDAEAEARKQQKQFELEISKSSKGTGHEVRKLENQVQKLTERATEAEAALETTSKELKEAKKERDGLKKEADELRSQMGQAQAIMSEVQTLRVETKEQQTRLVELEESYKKEKTLRKKYYNEIEDMKGKIRVYCRIRPMAKYELEKNCKQSVHPVDEYSVKVQTSKGDKEFMFDRTFPPDVSQEAVYEDTQRLIQSVIDGFNVCIFAYGQTGSGKTFTIQGNASFPGVAPRAINDLFETLETYDKRKFTYSVDVYMCELYNNQLVDLLLPDDKKKAPPALDIKKDVNGMVLIPGITLRRVENKSDLSKIFAYGLEARHVSGTAMNAESSRSHLIFSVIVTLEDNVAGKRANGKLSLIDLAGSERVSKSGVTKERLVEAREINKSLSALGDVISALSSGESFVPYRNHKLTQLMSDSLGGTAKTLMFVNVSPADYNTDETVTSLMYASRVKLITNDATKQVESKQIASMKDTIKNLTLIIEKLKKGEDTSELEKQLNQGKVGAPQDDGPPPPEEPGHEQDYEEPPDLPAY